MFYIVQTAPRKRAKRHIANTIYNLTLQEVADKRDIYASYNPYYIWEVYTGNWIKAVDKYGRILIQDNSCNKYHKRSVGQFQ